MDTGAQIGAQIATQTGAEAYKVLVVDDDREMRASLVELIEAAGWQVHALARASDVAKRWVSFGADVILSDVRMPGMSGLELLEALDEDAPPVVLISAHGDIPMAVGAMQNGAYSFVEKPYEPRRLLTILSHAAAQSRMHKTNTRLKARLTELSGLDRVLLGQSKEMDSLRREVFELAETRAAIFVHGETGTGKDLVARALHDLSPAGSAPFDVINCAILTPERLEAAREASGAGHTVFLDEICACPADVQAMLLRWIDDSTGIRFLCATNEQIDVALAQGRMRQDLFYRLNTFTLSLPALRERRDDIVLLLTHFMEKAAQLYEIPAPELSPDDIAAALAHDWPGNIRELRSVAERRVLQARRGVGSVASAIDPGEDTDDVPTTLREAVAAFEREMIGKALHAHEGRMDSVAEALGIGRRTLNEKIVKLGLDKDDYL